MWQENNEHKNTHEGETGKRFKRIPLDIFAIVDKSHEKSQTNNSLITKLIQPKPKGLL